MRAKLPFVFSLRGYVYQGGLDCIRLAAQSGQNSLQEAISSKYEQLREYEENGVFVGERDEDGEIFWEKSEILKLDIDRLQEAILELRRAFALSAYHYWEVAVYQWYHQDNPQSEKKNLGNYEGLKRALECLAKKDAALHNIPDKNLSIVSRISNVIKHTSESSAADLKKNIPDELAGVLKTTSKVNGFLPQIHLEEHHLNWIFDVVARSGPIANTNRV